MCRPHPRKLLAALLFPSLLPLPSSQQCTIDSSFPTCGQGMEKLDNEVELWEKKKKNKTERQFSRKAAKDTSRFHFLWHMQKSKHQPLSAAACTSLAQICTPLLSPPKSGSLHTTTVPQGSESSSLREESSCGAQIKRAFAFSSCASAPWEEIHANTQQRLIPSSILATLPEACL